ncbi:hypothetical protein AB0C12_31700 [Actinoplanes sp. NPDC048967]|uniref:hypothetical protein n=1 Tax=Actinoplanes sp. NPDC048967 TaxID=3155269 RepID=UPI0033FA2288
MSRRDALDGDSAIAELAASMGILHAHQSRTDFPGSIYVTPEIPAERTGGCVPTSGDALSEWVGDWAACPSRPDNLTKLMRPVGVERHLFVIVPGLASTAPFEVNDLLMRPGAPVPVAAPRLPDGVTHVWVMSTWSGASGFRWSLIVGWQTFANDAQLDATAVARCSC